MDTEKIFSTARLSNYKSEKEHIYNFLLMQKLAPKLGIIEIATRNLVATELGISDNLFISRQTFGYWARVINEKSIHNRILNLDSIDFRKYSKTNRKSKLKNYQKVRVCYDLLVVIRNRAFHFENLLKTQTDNKKEFPRISTLRNREVIGIMPENLEIFIDDILECFMVGLKDYLKSE